MNPHLSSPILIPAALLLLAAAITVGYQAVSAQNSPGSAVGSGGSDGRGRRRSGTPELDASRRRFDHGQPHVGDQRAEQDGDPE